MPGIFGDGQRGGIFGARVDPRVQAELERRADIRRSYTTSLSPMQELKFRDWKQRFAPNDSGEDYDLRGAFKAGFQPDPETGHWPDVYKKPNHPTFSNQSIYARDKPELAGSWDGDTYVASPLRRYLDVEAEQERQAQASSQAYLEQLDATRSPYVAPAKNLDPSRIPPREMPQSFDETLTGTIGDVVYGAPVIGPAALGLGARLGAAGQALQGKQGYSQALEDIQTKQEQFRRLNPGISGSAQAGGSSLFAPAFGSSMGAQVVGNAAMGGLDAMARGDDPSLAAAVGGGVAGALHLPAIFGGVMARTANLDALSLAKKMTAAGVPRERIWQETGWFKAPDKEWKFEISDEASRIGGPAMADLAARGETKRPTAGVLHHKDLYAAYPELREIDVNARHATDYPGSSGYYDAVASMKGPEIGIAVKELAGPEGPRSVMLHELQHPIQGIEGFGRGGSPAEYAHGPMFDPKARDLESDLSQALTGGLGAKPQEIELAARLYASPIQHDAIKAIARKHGFTSTDEALAFLKQQDEMRTPHGQYRRLAGEVEARNVQDRRNMTAEERRATPPWKTQDVPDEQQIVRFRGTGGAQESRAKVPAAGRTVSSRDNMPPAEGPPNPLRGTWKHPISANKLRDRPYEGMTSTTAPAPGQNLQDVTPFDLGKVREGDWVVPFLGDRTAGEGALTHVNEMPIDPVLQEGGSDYLRRPGSPLWASDPKVVGDYHKLVSRLQGELPKGNSIWGATVGMGPQSLDYSLQTTKTLLNMVKEGAPLTKKAKKAFDDAMKKTEWSDFRAYPDWPGIDNVTDEWLKGAGSARTKIAKLMDTAKFADMGFPNVAAARKANTHPELRGDLPFLPTGHAITRVGEGPVQHVRDPIDPHGSYRSQLKAEGSQYEGRLPLLVPGEIMFPGWARRLKPGLNESGKQRAFSMQEVAQRFTKAHLNRIGKFLDSDEGKKLGVAGLIGAGLLTADEAVGIFGTDGSEADRPAI